MLIVSLLWNNQYPIVLRLGKYMYGYGFMCWQHYVVKSVYSHRTNTCIMSVTITIVR